MTDHELLALAAKAAGHNLNWWGDDCWLAFNGESVKHWSPLKDDGDALRLAVKLNIHLGIERDAVSAWECSQFHSFCGEPCGSDKDAAMRRAIARAAAEIGRKIP